MVISLINHSQGTRIRLRVQAGTDDPTVPSLFDLFPGTEAMEREVWDLFGVKFDEKNRIEYLERKHPNIGTLI